MVKVPKCDGFKIYISVKMNAPIFVVFPVFVCLLPGRKEKPSSANQKYRGNKLNSSEKNSLHGSFLSLKLSANTKTDTPGTLLNSPCFFFAEFHLFVFLLFL